MVMNEFKLETWDLAMEIHKEWSTSYRSCLQCSLGTGHLKGEEDSMISSPRLCQSALVSFHTLLLIWLTEQGNVEMHIDAAILGILKRRSKQRFLGRTDLSVLSRYNRPMEPPCPMTVYPRQWHH